MSLTDFLCLTREIAFLSGEPRMKTRLLKFTVLFVLILGAFEVFVRANGPYFYALSDKLLLKAAILERSPDTNVLFLGTSRFVDAIEQMRFAEELESITGKKTKALNGATTGSQGERSAYFAKLAVKHEGLTHVILEATPPALKNGDLGFTDESGLAPAVAGAGDDDERFATRFENRLQDSVTSNVALVKYRKAMRPKTLLKLPVLYMADSVDPNTWSRKGLLRSMFTSPDVEITEELAAKFKPEIITADDLPDDAKPHPSTELYDNLIRLSDIFAESGIQVIWVAPPVSEEKLRSNYGRKYTRMYQAIAAKYDTVFYDYAGTPMDAEYLRDPTHMNANGRRLFSTVLARELAERFEETETKP